MVVGLCFGKGASGMLGFDLGPRVREQRYYRWGFIATGNVLSSVRCGYGYSDSDAICIF